MLPSRTTRCNFVDYVVVCVEARYQSDEITLDVPANPRIVVPEIVVREISFPIEILPWEPQGEVERSEA
jgi:hypothetical protein